jgi:Sulfotransferase domain.
MNRWTNFFFALLFAPLFLFGEASPFTLITIPKAGSHLVIKALHFMTGSPAIWHTFFPSTCYIPLEKGFLYTHFCLAPQLEQHYRALPKLKKIIVIRDLRDVAISIVSQICKAPWPGMTTAQRNNFKKLTFDQQLLFVINYEYDVYKVAKNAPNSNQASLIRVAKQAVQYASDPQNLVVRYENMVGEEGGGSLALQLNELNKIAAFIELELSNEQIRSIASQLYGNQQDPFGKETLPNFRSTFSKGKIGSWRGSFTEENKIAFKKKLGQSLIDLGYENGMDW